MLGPRGVSIDFTITDVDHELRAWAWNVGRGPIAVRLEHHVLPTPDGVVEPPCRCWAPQQHRSSPTASSPRPPCATWWLRVPTPPAGSAAETVSTFPFAFTASYAAAARLFGITPPTTGVEVGPAWLHVRYGHWRLMTPRSNIVSATITGDFSFARTAGPPHLSLADRGVSFTTNGDRALCLTFREPVVVLDPTGTVRHPGATLAVADPEGLAAALDLPL